MKVLFVCVGNSARSQMAEALFNRLAPKGYSAVSAGTQPARRVSSLAIKAMSELGIDISKAKPKLLTPEMVKKADRIITMGCLVEESCPSFLMKERRALEDWGIEDPRGKDIEGVRRIRDEVKLKVEQLLERLKV